MKTLTPTLSRKQERGQEKTSLSPTARTPKRSLVIMGYGAAA